MQTFAKYTCPYCKGTIQGWHKKYRGFGNPFVTCQSCGNIIKMSNINEWEAYSLIEKIEYWVAIVFGSIVYGGMAVVIIGLVLEQILNDETFNKNGSPTALFITMIIFGSLLSLIVNYRKFSKKIDESVKRTKGDKDYRKLLKISN